MRYLIVMGLLGGCYSPATESCYYACATQGQPCPTGLECVAGNVCATKGETCGPGGDAMNDIDSPSAVCGDGLRAVGEICYANPLTFVSASSPLDGVLVDRNGDSRLDLVYVTTTHVRSHANTGQALDPVFVDGPGVTNPRSMRPAQLIGDLNAELLIATDFEVQSWAFIAANGYYSQIGQYFPIGGVLTFEVARMTDGPLVDIVLLDPNNNLRVVQLQSPSASTQISTQPVAVTPNSKLVVGQVTTDQRSDVLLLSPTGITVYAGAPNGLFSGIGTPVTSSVTDARIGDINGDGHGTSSTWWWPHRTLRWVSSA